ncbi:MAG: hypothetical protein ABI197_05395 [Granulicella sp.]
MRLHATLFLAVLVPAALAPLCIGQQSVMPRDYRGPQTYISGIFVTPVPNAPFSAKVEIVSQQKLPDGSLNTRTTTTHIARTTSGVIYNERRQFLPTAAKGDPVLLSIHTYDPSTRLSTILDPFTHLAKENVLQQPPTAPAHSVPTPTPANPMFKEEQLGTQNIGSVLLQGIRKSRTIPATMSGTGQEVVVVDEYWYSPDLSIYMILKHEDPRSGEQIVAVTEVERTEPDAKLFAIPANYKIVDETPVP